MKKLILIPMVLVLFSCVSQKQITPSVNDTVNPCDDILYIQNNPDILKDCYPNHTAFGIDEGNSSRRDIAVEKATNWSLVDLLSNLKPSEVKFQSDSLGNRSVKTTSYGDVTVVNGTAINMVVLKTFTYEEKRKSGLFKAFNQGPPGGRYISIVITTGTLKDGKSTFYYENGQIKGEGNYKDGERNGKWTAYYENGQIRAEENFKAGERDGKSIDYYENGQIKQEENFKDGKYIGDYNFYFENGNQEWKYYYNNDGTRDSTKLTSRWYETGGKWYEGYIKTINDSTFVWDGKKTSYYENGQIEKEENFKDGEQDGKWNWYHENGQIKGEENFKDGKQIGTWIYYYEKGQISAERNYKDDKWTSYYENGQIRAEGNFKDRKKDGKSTSYYENGQIAMEGNYKDGKEEGKWTDYNEDGSIRKVEEYKDGELVK